MRNVIFRFTHNRIRIFGGNVFEFPKVVEKQINEVVEVAVLNWQPPERLFRGCKRSINRSILVKLIYLGMLKDFLFESDMWKEAMNL
jgi:hypothetical protein